MTSYESKMNVMSIYGDFNEYIYLHFFGDENVGQFICLSVDDSFINQFCSKKDIDLLYYKSAIMQELGKDWSNVITASDIDGMPKYLGLLAIQVYAAYLMRKDSLHSERAYNPRMIELLGLNSDYELQSLYRAHQNDVWARFKDWCAYKGYLVELPSPTTGMRCFIQYPISQALLNQEDYRALSRFFIKRQIRPSEHFSFTAFCKLTFPVEKREINRHFDQLYERHLELGTILNLKKQLFSYYNNWDGSGQMHYGRENVPSLIDIGDQRFHKPEFQLLILNSNLTSAKLTDAWDRELKIFDLNVEGLREKISNHGFVFPYNHVIVFKYDNDYNDWIETRYVNRYCKCILLFDKSKTQLLTASSYKQLAGKDYSTAYYYIYEFDLNALPHEEIYRFRNFLDGDLVVELYGGLKLSRKIYMYGAGPSIRINKPGMVWINSIRLSLSDYDERYSCTDFECGPFVVKSEFDSAIYFEIRKSSFNMKINESGWLISRESKQWTVMEENGNANGLWYSLNLDCGQGAAQMRKWIEGVLDGGKIKTDVNDSLIIRALKRSKNGIE